MNKLINSTLIMKADLGHIYIYIQGRSHIVAPPAKKKKKFPLDYEEKINGPPIIRQPAPLPISHPF